MTEEEAYELADKAHTELEELAELRKAVQDMGDE